LRVLRDRNRGGALLANTVNNLSTFGMLLILTYQLQTVLGYSALRTGLALLPLAIGAVVAAALIAPRLGKRIAPRWLIAAGILLGTAIPAIALVNAGIPAPRRPVVMAAAPGAVDEALSTRRRVSNPRCGVRLLVRFLYSTPK
jgi:Na+/melibiose symporter-like transporter